MPDVSRHQGHPKGTGKFRWLRTESPGGKVFFVTVTGNSLATGRQAGDALTCCHSHPETPGPLVCPVSPNRPPWGRTAEGPSLLPVPEQVLLLRALVRRTDGRTDGLLANSPALPPTADSAQRLLGSPRLQKVQELCFSGSAGPAQVPIRAPLTGGQG